MHGASQGLAGWFSGLPFTADQFLSSLASGQTHHPSHTQGLKISGRDFSLTTKLGDSMPRVFPGPCPPPPWRPPPAPGASSPGSEPGTRPPGPPPTGCQLFVGGISSFDQKAFFSPGLLVFQGDLTRRALGRGRERRSHKGRNSSDTGCSRRSKGRTEGDFRPAPAPGDHMTASGLCPGALGREGKGPDL